MSHNFTKINHTQRGMCSNVSLLWLQWRINHKQQGRNLEGHACLGARAAYIRKGHFWPSQHQGQVHNNVAGNYLAAAAGTLYILFAYRINGAASHELRHLCLMYCAVNEEMQRSARRPRGLTTRIAARTPHLSRATLFVHAPRDTETTTIESSSRPFDVCVRAQIFLWINNFADTPPGAEI